MADELEPALSAEEWRQLRDTEYRVDMPFAAIIDSALSTSEEKAIAILNDALPDDSEYKITREAVDTLNLGLDNLPRAEDEDYREYQRAKRAIAALYALLPPEH